MENQENEDAITDANRYAGKIVDMSSRPLNELSLKRMQKEYVQVFEAFVAGVVWARKQKGDGDGVHRGADPEKPGARS